MKNRVLHYWRHLRGVAVLDPSRAFDRWAASYRDGMNPLQVLEESALKRLLPDVEGKTIVDVGCGTGRVSGIALERGVRATVGIDPSEAMLKAAAERVSGPAEWICGDLRRLPVESRSFDVAVCALVLGHVADLPAALSEIDRVVVRGGRVVISDFHPFATLRGWKRTFTDEAEGREFAIEQRAHLFEDYVCRFSEMGWILEALEEPRFEGFPVAFVLRARLLTEETQLGDGR